MYSPWMDVEELSREDQDFLTNIEVSNLSFTNFYRFYGDYVDQLLLYNAAKLVGNKLQNIDPQEAQRLHAEVRAIEKELVSLRAQLKKESMFNCKVELNVEIKKLEDRKAIKLKELENNA